MKRILFYILMASILVSGHSCSKIEPEVTVVDQRIVILSSIGGMGDHGYNDLVMSGLLQPMALCLRQESTFSYRTKQR